MRALVENASEEYSQHEHGRRRRGGGGSEKEKFDRRRGGGGSEKEKSGHMLHYFVRKLNCFIV